MTNFQIIWIIATGRLGTNDAFNQFSNSSVRNGVSALDLRVMDVIGYDPVPEPSTVILLITGLAAIAFARRVAR
jgi:hypothetical protein